MRADSAAVNWFARVGRGGEETITASVHVESQNHELNEMQAGQ